MFHLPKGTEAQGVSFTAKNIKVQAPTAEELNAWRVGSGLPLEKSFNTSGILYKSHGLNDKLPGMNDDEQIALLTLDEMLVKRPS